MTSAELKTKLDAAQEKVSKRLNTIAKLCKKLGINFDAFLNEYRQVANQLAKDGYTYLPSKVSVAPSYFNYKQHRREDGTVDHDAYDYNDKLSQLRDNLYKLYEVEVIAKNWQVKYDTQKNKEDAPKIEVIWDFLTKWEQMAHDWYVYQSNVLVKEYNKFHEVAYNWLTENFFSEYKKLKDYRYNDPNWEEKYDAENKFRKEKLSEFNSYMYETLGVWSRYNGYAVDVDDYVKDFDGLTKSLTTIRFRGDDSNFDRISGFSSYTISNGKYEITKFDEEQLNKILAQDKLNKYNDLCNRISGIVGEITDASNLSVGAKGELNGIVVGTRGKAKVETISAGGWNIQCFHYRTLVNRVK